MGAPARQQEDAREERGRPGAAAVEAMKSPAVKERLSGLGAQVASDDRMTPAYLGTFLKSEIEKWAAPIKASGVQVD